MGGACGKSEGSNDAPALKQEAARAPAVDDTSAATEVEESSVALFHKKDEVPWDTCSFSTSPNPKGWMHIDLCDEEFDASTDGRVEFELFAHIAPKTVENFRALLTGEKGRHVQSGKMMSFESSKFHRIIPEFMLQGGDITQGNGKGGTSIFGERFPDENFDCPHSCCGILSMANAGADTNNSQFFITTAECSKLDGKHVAFGVVTKGFTALTAMEALGQKSGRPRRCVTIQDCGLLPETEWESRPHGWRPTGRPCCAGQSELAAAVCYETAPLITRNKGGSEEPHSENPLLYNIDGAEVDLNAQYTVGGQMWYLQERALKNKSEGKEIAGTPMLPGSDR